MPAKITCVTGLGADDKKITIPGGTTLRFDVQVDSEVDEFEVDYTILSDTDVVRFKGGAITETIPLKRTGSMMKVEHDVSFVCCKADQDVVEFVAFTVGAQVILGGIVESAPLSNPSLQVTKWACGSATMKAGKANTIMAAMEAPTSKEKPTSRRRGKSKEKGQ